MQKQKKALIYQIVVLISFLIIAFGSATLDPTTTDSTPMAPAGGYIANGWSNYIYNNYVIHFTSDPSGVKIEWNNDLIGTTPFDYTINGSCGNGTSYTVIAIPTKAGQYTQTKVLRNPMPSNVYFNMNLAPTNNNYNININK